MTRQPFLSPITEPLGHLQWNKSLKEFSFIKLPWFDCKDENCYKPFALCTVYKLNESSNNLHELHTPVEELELSGYHQEKLRKLVFPA